MARAPRSAVAAAAEAEGAIRLDKWLWQARFFKSRSLAARAVEGGMRINGQRVSKPSASLRPGDVVTFAQARLVRVVRVLAPGVRRGPASEARSLYEDLSPPAAPGADAPGAPVADASAPRPLPGGRPSGRARRQFRAMRPDSLLD